MSACSVCAGEWIKSHKIITIYRIALTYCVTLKNA